MDRLYPGEKVWRFEYGLDEFLNGIPGFAAEAIGFGLYKVHEFDGELLIDGAPSNQKEGAFSESLRAVNKQGRSKIEVHLGRPLPLNPVFWPIPDYVTEFAGWTLAPAGWSFLEPVYTYEALDSTRPIGAPSPVSCYTANSFFLRNEDSLLGAQWASDRLEFTTLDDFPAPFARHPWCEFSVEVPAENQGVQLARFLDATSEPASAEVFVNGQPAGRWSYPFTNPSEPVQADVFGLPVSLTEGRTDLHIKLVADDHWNAAWYGIDVLLPRLQ